MVEFSFTSDMFNTNQGTLIATINIVNKETHTVPQIEKSAVRNWIFRTCKLSLISIAEGMMNQRRENYKHAEMATIREYHYKALDRLPFFIMTARQATDLEGVALAFDKSILPALQDIQPGESSRFYEHYTDKLERLTNCIQNILKNSGYFEQIFQQKSPEFSI
jgi:hypothetical protein